MIGGYDDGYEKCPCFWGNTPGKLVSLLLESIDRVNGKSILDLGAGEGKNSFFLANLGADVTAVEVSAAAKANAKEHEAYSTVEWIKDDAVLFTPEKEYDVIIAYGLMHCLPSSSDVESLITRMKSVTKPGGYNIIVTMNDRKQDLSGHNDDFTPLLLPHTLYSGLYSQWELIHCTDTDLHEKHPHNNIQHCHSMTRILARKK